MSSSVQFDRGNTRTLSPGMMRALYRSHSSGRWCLGSQRCCALRKENTRSLARDFSSSRRAPPMAASKPQWSSACFRACVFMTSVCTVAPCVKGPMPRARPSGLVCTRNATPVSCARRIAEGDHFAELPAGVHVQQRNRRAPGREGLEQQVQQHRAVLADRIQQHRIAEVGRHLAQDVQALCFETIEVAWRAHRAAVPAWSRDLTERARRPRPPIARPPPIRDRRGPSRTFHCPRFTLGGL
jgi:hypothetical protein